VLVSDHLDRLVRAIAATIGLDDAVSAWGRHLAQVLSSGGRLLASGNGGSAAQAQHLTAELSGRYHTDREPLSAIALCTEAPALTAIGNDYGFDQAFARQVRAHGRPGDVLILLSTSGRSQNLIEAAKAGHQVRMTTWALTGPAPNPLAAACDDAVTVAADTPATVQELHLASVHILCASVDEALLAGAADVVGEMAGGRPAAALDRQALNGGALSGRAR
jgi:D-sedoheptulose 7-phosphate isomerase